MKLFGSFGLFGTFGKINEIKKEIRWFFQRGKKGYCDKDLWELNTWFATTFSNMLKEFSEMAVDYPPGFPDFDVNTAPEGQIMPHNICDSEERENNKQYLAWKAAIKETADLFADTGGYWIDIPSEKAKMSCNKAFEFLKKNFFDLWC